MFRFAIVSLSLATAAPVFAGDQSLYPHTHTNTTIEGSFTTPINYRPLNGGQNKRVNNFVEGEIIRSPAYNHDDTKLVKRERRGAGSAEETGPVTEIFVENLPKY